MWDQLLRYSGYAYAAKEASNWLNRSSRKEQLRREQSTNILLGFAVGTAVGLTTGLLVAPNPGRETRAKIRGQTSETIGSVRESARDARDRFRKRSSRLAASAKDCAEDLKEGVRGASGT
jgi:gas vesicle protein